MKCPKNGYFATNTALVTQPDSTWQMNTVISIVIDPAVVTQSINSLRINTVHNDSY